MPTAQITKTQSKRLNIALWIAQGLLAAMFLMAGVMKTITPIEQLAESAPWVKDLPGLVRFIGIAELAAGLGLLLPSLLRIKPILTPLAACGLLTIMVFAMVYHGMHAEYGAIGTNLIIALIAAFIAWGRFKRAPIAAK